MKLWFPKYDKQIKTSFLGTVGTSGLQMFNFIMVITNNLILKLQGKLSFAKRDLRNFSFLSNDSSEEQILVQIAPFLIRIEILALRALSCALGSKGLDKFVNIHFLKHFTA